MTTFVEYVMLRETLSVDVRMFKLQTNRESKGKKRNKMIEREAKFQIGEVVKHRVFAFRGVIFDVDPTFNNTEEWWMSIPAEVRPKKDQPFYHLLAESDDSEYIAYVSEQNLLRDTSEQPIRHPEVNQIFEKFDGTSYSVRVNNTH